MLFFVSVVARVSEFSVVLLFDVILSEREKNVENLKKPLNGVN